MPRGRERAGLRLAVTHHHRGDQARVVECGAVGMRDRIAEFAAFMDRAGRFRRAVTADTAGEGEAAEEAAQAVLVVGDLRIDVAIAAFQIEI